MRLIRFSRRIHRFALVVGLLAFAAPAFATAPATLQLDGVLLTTGGGAVVDGPYKLTFTLWDADKNGTKLWGETLDVAITSGRFDAALGASGTAIDVKALAGGVVWLGVAVGNDPELPRRQLHAAAFAMRAAVAEGVECSGCISAASAAFNYAGSATKGGPAVDVDCTACDCICLCASARRRCAAATRNSGNRRSSAGSLCNITASAPCR